MALEVWAGRFMEDGIEGEIRKNEPFH